uniref:Endonuclease/exonuclease/phosphatase domain-containing protein n=1 Tax=Octopus bimaculoides TaxID=37653 RepID=A0A0L8GSJ3_OCTBM
MFTLPLEVRWTGSGKISSGEITLLYSGPEDAHQRGVGLMLCKEAARSLIGWNAQCQGVLNNIPNHDIVLFVGNMNAQIGNNRAGLEHVIGPHGSATETSDNGERLLLFDDKIENEIDYIGISKKWRSALTDVRVCRGADIGSDRHLVQGKVQLRLKKMQKPKPIRPFAVEKLKDQQKSQQFRLALENKFEPLLQATDIEEQWAIFREAVAKVADQLGRRRGKEKQFGYRKEPGT